MRSGKYILLGLALCWTLWFVFAGFGNIQDPLYWLYKYQHLEGGWMAVGTLLAGGAMVRLFGSSLLALRLAGWGCVVVAVALPYVCLLNKEQRRDNLHWLALTYFLMGYGAFQEFSPGTLSVLLLSAIWVTAFKSPMTNDQLPILTAILLGLAVAVRFPNILVLLVLLPLWKKRSLWYVPVAALTAGIVYVIGYFCITPASMDAAMSSHELWSMLTKLWDKSGMLIGAGLIGIAVLAIGKKNFLSPISALQSPIAKAIIVGLLLIIYVLTAIKPQQWYNIDLTYLISALCLVIALGKSPITNYQLPIGVAIMIVATLGTDTAWLKLFPAMLCLLPVAASNYEQAERRYLWIVLALFSTVVMVRFATNSVGKCNLTQATTVCSVAPYEHIAIQQIENEWLEQLKNDIDGDTTVLALGQRMHLMRAVTGCKAGRYNEFWSNIFDSVYTAKYERVIQQSHPTVVCSFTPQFKTQPEYKDKQSALERMLLGNGYHSIDRSEYHYMIYVYDEEIQ